VPFDARDLSSLASWLTEQRTDEASIRTAISRVYYAAHLLVVRKPKNNWVPTGTGADHRGVIRALNRGATTRLASLLEQLLELREHADYHVEATDTVFNRGCRFCKKIAASSSQREQVVDLSHWEEVKKISARLFPLLEKL
jgi:hypothetical protein